MKKTLIIAEAGVNHNGDISIAKKLIDAAVNAGADIVKFQTFKTDNLVSKLAKKADYQIQNTENEDSQHIMLKKLELSEDDHYILINYCKQKGIQFLSTAFDMESLDFLIKLGLNIFKIPSGEITNLPYLKKIGKLNKKVILSTGMCSLKEIRDAYNILLNNGTLLENITILHCNTEYPTPMKDVNLLAMNTIGKTFNVNVGYSDHTLGIEIPIAAVSLGATIIEKHFTLDKKMTGPDHAASLEPNELSLMVKAIRNIEQAFGSEMKQVSNSEAKNITIARKSIHLRRNLANGDIICEDDLIMKRPGNGISPMDMPRIIGKMIKRDVEIDTKLSWEDLH
jgi:N,N'-diacetyllegionaminate synthase